MAERTVSVRLVARIEAYQAAMAKAAASTAGFSASSARSLTSLGSSMQTVGKKMTTFVSLPIAALAGLATKMAADFETSFAQMVGLANVPAAEIDGLRESVLSLAGETAQAPQELADGLYLAASAGLDSATAMDVVQVAAHGAAAGMGDTATVVDLLTTVINAYGTENISAADAADVLTAAVREGKAAPDEMANALGRVLPISSALGISFGETAGAVAFLTNAGLDTDEAVTSLRATMLALIRPSAQARATLEAAGISMDDMRAAIADRGLMGALDLLRSHGFADNTEALGHVIENTRGLVGAQALLADESGRLGSILDATENSTGALGDAWAAISETDAFKLKQALTDIKTAMIEVGVILLPIVADIAGAISGLAKFFVDLPGPVQDAVLAFGGLLAIGGPLVFIAGSLIRNLSLIIGVMGSMPAGVRAAASAFGAFAVAAGVAYVAWQILGQGHVNAGVSIDTSADALIRATSAGFAEATAAGEAAGEIDALTLAHQALSVAISENADSELQQIFASFNISAGETLDVLSQLREGMSSTGDQAGYIDQQIELIGSRLGISQPLASRFWTSFVMGTNDSAEAMDEFTAATGVSRGEIESTVTDLETLKTASIQNTGEIDQMARAFLDAAVTAGGAGREAVLLAEQVAGSRREAGHGILVYKEYVRILAGMAPAERDAILAANDMTASLVGLSPEAIAAALSLDQVGAAAGRLYDKSQPPVIKELANQFESTATKAELLGGAVLESGGKFDEFAGLAGEAATGLDEVAASGVDASDAFSQLTRAVDAHWLDQLRELSGLQGPQEGWINVLGLTEIENFGTNLHKVLDPQQEFIRSQDAIWQAGIDFAAAMDEGTTSLDRSTDAGQTNRAMLMDWMDAIEAGADAQIANGDSIADVNQTLDYNVTALRNAALAAGFNEEEVDNLIDTYLNVPESVATAIQLSGDDIAMQKIENLLLQMDVVDDGVIAEVNAVIEADGAWAGYHYLVDYINTHSTTVQVVANTLAAQEAIAKLARAISVDINLFAQGGYFDTPTMGVFGEAGPEVILPLTNRQRMSELLGMPEVAGPIAAAFGGNLVSGGGGGGGGGGGSYTTNVSVIMPAGSNGDDVVRALRKWERRRGPIPVATR